MVTDALHQQPYANKVLSSFVACISQADAIGNVIAKAPTNPTNWSRFFQSLHR